MWIKVIKIIIWIWNIKLIGQIDSLEYTTYKMAGKSTPLSKALSLWEEKNGKPAAEAEEIKLIFLVSSPSFRFPPFKSFKPQS